ncbi:MAG: Crp/Fnr family transcriptional regulator [Alphaproteobacteria bacterium]|nr:MAG: Crp/Fnr family transcriptional regulator [Alphaproteobacteria bacterium]
MPLTKSDIWPTSLNRKSGTPQIFYNLSEDVLQKLLNYSVLQHFPQGRLLVQQGDKPEYLYFIVDGTVKTLRQDEHGREATLRLLRPGETCMEAVIFMEGDSPIAVQVASDAKLLLIPVDIVRKTVLSDTQFANNLLRIVSYHYKNAMHQIDSMHIKNPTQRLGYYFLLKHLENGHDNMEFTLPFQKSAIANYLGMTPETFSRTLQKLKQQGISFEDNTIKMRDAYVLCHYCDSDAESLCRTHPKDECFTCPMGKDQENKG